MARLKRGLLEVAKPLDDTTWKELRQAMLAAVKSRSDGWTDIQRKVIHDRVNNLNSPTNAEKLSKPFDVLKVPLRDQEMEAIILRHKFLHAGRILDPDVVAGDGDAWRTAYAAEMRIYTAVNKLLLRYLGYTGPVVDWGENPLDSPEWTFVPL